MAAAPQVDLVEITINGVDVSVPKGELIVEAVKRVGLEIPIFCYHPRMKPVGMCRMCLVEVGFKQADGSVRKMPRLQAACSLPADKGMVIYTDSEVVHRDRKGILEFLLINHPLDCPICDRGGECPLQNNTLAYGPSTSRFTEIKRHLPKAYPLSQYVTLDLERCIQCGRCVRFTEEISGDAQLAFRFRGAEMQPSTFQLTDFESKFSGNVIEICPVGALTSAKYRFRARPWDLETKPGLCTITPCGTNVWFDTRSGKHVRINGRTNEAVNEEWTSDKTKFGHDFYNSPTRLKTPNLRSGEGFVPVGWSEAYKSLLPQFEGGSCAVLVGTNNITNESLFALQKLFRKGFQSSHIDHRLSLPRQPRAERLENKLGIDPVQLTIAQLEYAKSILVFGTSLADEEPMTFLRVRKAWFRGGAKVVVAHHEPTDADRFAYAVLRYKPGTEAALASGLADLASGTGSLDDIAAETGVDKNALADAALVLGEGIGAVISTYSLLARSPKAVEVLAQMKAPFSLMALEANQQGAIELGVLPDTLPGGASDPAAGLDTEGILTAAAEGKIKALWLVNCDPLSEFPDRALAERALENVEYLVVIHHDQVEACEYASLVLPMALPAEQDGTTTNVERRVQRMGAILTPPGDAKAPWRIFTEVLLRIKPSTPAFNPREIMEEIRQAAPRYRECGYENLGGEGVLAREPEPATV
jgi:NADH-quinone oxidoreductase subunit G